MNLYHQALMDKPSYYPHRCPICGAYPMTGHHVVPKSQGGHDGPVIGLCGHGTAGCHGKAEDKKLHFRWSDQIDWWEWLELTTPTKYDTALGMEGWQRLQAA